MRDIKSVNKLLFVLGLDEDFFRKVAANKTNHYKPRDHKKVMPDGYEKIRRIDHPDTEIRTVQRAINKKLLTDECVNLTEEMTGGIKNRSASKSGRSGLKLRFYHHDDEEAHWMRQTLRAPT